ncbi:MAG: PAS domain S-box protein, partial [Prolixibacteraceae bacterium]|nr:PAS domain S-box protein [Prolixibacteraceae bacterium]
MTSTKNIQINQGGKVSDLEHQVLKYKAIIEQAAEMLFLHNMQGRIVEVNHAAINQTGYTLEELLSLTVFDIDKNAEGRLDKSNIWNTLRNLDNKTIETTHWRKDGSTYDAEVSIGKITIGNEDFLLGLAKDISERKRLENELRESEINARAIMEATNDLLFLLDKDGVVIDTNEAHAKRFNITGKELIGKNVFTLLPEKIAKERKKLIEKAFDTGKPVVGEDFRAGFWNEYTIHPIFENSKVAKRVAVYVRDITEKKKYEQELAENFALLRIAGNSAKFGGWCFEIEKNILTWSEQVRLIHEAPENFQPNVENGINFYAPEWRDKITEVFSRCVQDGIPYNEEMQILTYNSNRIWVRTTGEAFRNKKGKIIQINGAFQDINERKTAQEALRKSEEKLKEFVVAKDKFFSIISHDLRSPFSTIVSLSELMANEQNRFTTDEYKQYARALNRTAATTFDLLENLLEWSRFQQGVIPFQPEQIQLETFLERFFEVFKEQANKKGIQLNLNFEKDLHVFADKEMLASILRNLLSNAIKFTLQNGNVNVQAKKYSTGEVLFGVSDTGIGMPQYLLNKLFNISEKVSQPGTNGEPSTGLGLVLCKEFVEKHGGRIWAE